MKLKIMYIVSTLARTGPTNQLFNIVKNLDKNFFSPIIVTLSPEPKSTLIDLFNKENIKIHSLNFSRFEGAFKAGKIISKIIEKYDPDIIHTQGLRPDSLAVKYIKGKNVITTIRNFPFEDYPLKFGKLLGRIMAYNHINSIRNIDYPVACSLSLQKKFKTRLNIDVDVIQNGVNTDKYNQINDSQKKKLRNKLGIPTEKKVFISVGALIKRKAPEVVIDGFLNMDKSSESLLFILGDGPLMKNCEEMVKKYKNVILLGSINNVNQYLQASDYFISASTSEGLPNTVLEALSVGLPVCLSDIDPHEEILNQNKECGILFKVNNRTDLSKKLNHLIQSDYSIMRGAALNLIKSNFSAKIMSNKYQELYKKISSVSTKC